MLLASNITGLSDVASTEVLPPHMSPWIIRDWISLPSVSNGRKSSVITFSSMILCSCASLGRDYAYPVQIRTW